MAKFSFPKLSKSINLDRFLICAGLAVIIWYTILCFANYFSLRPLWNDEECVLNSVKAFTTQEMFSRPLLNLQVFPRVYLFFIQQMARPFDFHLLSLRFFSFICMLGAFFVWLKIANYQLKNKLEFLTFTLSWTASAVLIYYAAELKQYSMDVLVGAFFILFLYHQKRLEENNDARYPALLFLLPFLILFSYAALFFCLLPLYNLFVSLKKDKRIQRLIWLYGASLLMCAVISYTFDVRLRPAALLEKEWRNHFIVLSSVPEFFRSFGEGVMNLLTRWFVEHPKILKKIGIFFMMPGFLYMFYSFAKNIKKEQFYLRSLSTIGLIVFIELFIFGALKKYPFTVPRTSLFFCPVVLYFAIQAIAFTKNWHAGFYRVFHAAYLLYLIYLTSALSGITLSGNITFRPVLW